MARLSGGYSSVRASMSRLAPGKSLQMLEASPTGQPIITSGGISGGGQGGGGGVSAPTGGAGGSTAVAGGSDIMNLYTQALQRLSTGGMSLEASLADIEEGKRQAIARGQQSLVSGGLAGTTVMGGVPVAAEKTAGRARLAARGEAESKYLTTLASYAAFAQRAQESAKDRASALQRLQLQIGAQERMATQPSGNVVWPEVRPATGATISPSIERVTTPTGPTTATNYSSQFPSIYGEAEEPTPNWMT